MLPFNKFLIPTTFGAALLLAACGSSSHKPAAQSPVSPAAPASQSGSSSAITVSATHGSLGTYLTGASGRSLYIWLADGKGKSNCA
jgi:predicted lipoprotein with Yx(FWY)xxD motif